MKTEQKDVAEFRLSEMLGIALTVVVTGIGIAYGINVVSDVGTEFTANTKERNATDDALEGLAKLPAKLPLIMTVVVAAILIGILVRYLWTPGSR